MHGCGTMYVVVVCFTRLLLSSSYLLLYVFSGSAGMYLVVYYGLALYFVQGS